MQQFSVVISGFDHYEDIDVNPSAEVPKMVAEQGIGISSDADDPLADVSVTIHAVTLPISFTNSWPQLLEAIEAAQPDIVIATGFKYAARGIALERCATNVMDIVDEDDVASIQANAATTLRTEETRAERQPIAPDGPAAYWTKLPLHAILTDFAKHNIPATLSSDAGTYVCNSLFYHLLCWTSVQKKNVLSGFVSFPKVTESHSQTGLTLDQQVEACRDVIREAIHYHLHPSSQEILLS